MAEIVIRTGKPESIRPILDSAIRNQLKLLKASINRTQIRISSFEQKYNISSEQFVQKIREGMDDDNLDFVEWIGETKILKRLEEEYKELEGIADLLVSEYFRHLRSVIDTCEAITVKEIVEHPP